MIRLIFGNVGSGKTASMVRYMRNNPEKKFITNIEVKGKGFKHVMKLKADMIIKREVIRTKKTGEDVVKLALNRQFWIDLIQKEKQINIIIDEAHIFFNPRRSMSRLNILMTDFLALLRRVLGSSDGAGELILITQLSRRLDVIAKEMSTDVSYCVHHYHKRCSSCSLRWQENNETANKYDRCPRCSSPYIKRSNSIIEVYDFKSVGHFMEYLNFRTRTYYRRYLIKDIETIFGNYNTLQFDDLLSEY